MMNYKDILNLKTQWEKLIIDYPQIEKAIELMNQRDELHGNHIDHYQEIGTCFYELYANFYKFLHNLSEAERSIIAVCAALNTLNENSDEKTYIALCKLASDLNDLSISLGTNWSRVNQLFMKLVGLDKDNYSNRTSQKLDGDIKLELEQLVAQGNDAAKILADSFSVFNKD